MSRIALAIAPNTNATLSVLGVTTSEIVLAGQDGKTQSVKIGEYPELDKAKAGDVGSDAWKNRPGIIKEGSGETTYNVDKMLEYLKNAYNEQLLQMNSLLDQKRTE